MSTPSRRRNRSLASCEPCRKRKTRCDHGKPICASCQRRGLRSQCWYHPAPLAKQETFQNPALSISQDSDPVVQHECVKEVNSSSVGTPIFHTWPFLTADHNDATPETIFTGSHNYNIKAHDQHLKTMEDIVSQLRFLPVIEKQIHEYYSFSQVALVPRSLISQLITSVRMGLTASDYMTEDGANQHSIHHGPKLAESLLRSSSSEVTITPDLDLEGFCALFSGPNLRIETLGLLFTIAARSFSSDGGYQRDKLQNDTFVQEMGWYGNLSLRLARELAPQTTDLITWLAHENLQLTTTFEGDASVWRRVGDLATDLLALGLNREAAYTATPFFLAECRRRNFVRAYYLDKVFAAVFNRPPRITARYADCKPPLDLSDDDLFTSTDELNQAKKSLTQDGWNTDGKYRAVTWARIRYILAEFREETVEYQYRPMQPVDKIKLRDLSHRCFTWWDALPYRLQYRQDCWTSNLPPAICHMHAKVYLSYLHIHFQVYRLLDNGDGNMSLQPELLEVSANMLETVIQMTTSRGRTSFSPPELPGIILAYGLPCAAILSTALEKFMQNPARESNITSGISISTLIRNLSVLVSQLEVLTSPSETNHVFCIKASKAISHRLDHILNGFTSANSTKPSDVIPEPPPTVPTLPPLYTSSTATMANLDSTDPVDLDRLYLADWGINFDMSLMSDEWNMF